MSVDALLTCLPGAKRTGQDRYMARCPAHADKCASLSIRELDDGRTLIHCFGGCSVAEVLSSVGLDFDVLFPEKPADHTPRKAIKKPWRASDVVRALDFELTVALVLLSDISTGREFSAIDRERASFARERILNFIQELANAY